METRFLLEYQNKVGTAEQEIDNQAAMQRELLDRDMAEIRRDWLQVEQIWQMLRRLLAGKSDRDVG